MMNCEPIDIVRVVRRMRGGSQAHLVEGHDGFFYVAKFVGNPQGTRTLINEWFAHQLFRKFDVSIPPLRVLRLTKAVQESTEDLVFRQGNTHTKIEPGLHLGSRCPVNPETTAIFDFLPKKLLQRVTNPGDFAKTLVLDLFLGQANSRQAIFIRERSGRTTWQMRAYMIDQGWVLGGALWHLVDNRRRCLYYDRTIYSHCGLAAECEQTLHLVSTLTKENLDLLAERIPPSWFLQSDQTDWARLLSQLIARKSQLPYMVNEYLQMLTLDQQASSQENTGGGDSSLIVKKPVSDTAAIFALG